MSILTVPGLGDSIICNYLPKTLNLSQTCKALRAKTEAVYKKKLEDLEKTLGFDTWYPYSQKAYSERPIKESTLTFYETKYHKYLRYMELDSLIEVAKLFYFEKTPNTTEEVLKAMELKKEKFTSLPLSRGKNSTHPQLRRLSPLIVNLSKVNTLLLKRHLLSELPEEITKLPIINLELSHNQFERLPAWIGKMTSLQYLYVENNPNLTTLPKELASLPNLKQLRIKNTGIKSLPPELMNSTNPAIQAAVKSLAANPS